MNDTLVFTGYNEMKYFYVLVAASAFLYTTRTLRTAWELRFQGMRAHELTITLYSLLWFMFAVFGGRFSH